MLFVKRAMPIPSVRWHKVGDHPAVLPMPEHLHGKYGKECGWIPIKEGGYIVGPGDFIVTDKMGSSWPVPPERFFNEYYMHDPNEQLDKEQLRIIQAIEHRHWIDDVNEIDDRKQD